MLKLALRNLFRQKGRTVITLIAIVFGVAALVLAGGFVEDIFVQLRDATIHSRLGYVQLYRTGYYEYGTRDPYKYMIEDPSLLNRNLRKISGVEDVLQRVNFSGLLNNGNTDRAVFGEGVEPAKEAELGSLLTIISGRQLADSDDYGILLGEGVANALQLKPGDYVDMVATMAEGGMNSLEFEVVGVFRTFSKDFDARAIRIPLTTAQELIDTAAVHSLVLSLNTVELVNPLSDWLRKKLPGDRYEVKTWLELDQFYRKTVDLYKSQFGVLQLIILGIVLLSVANSVSMTATERIGEFGTLRALGRKSSDVYKLLIIESTVLGLLGATIGLALGILLAVGLSEIGIPMPPPPNSNSGYTAMIRVVPATCAIAFMVGFLATVISALITCRGPTRGSITDALRQNI